MNEQSANNTYVNSGVSISPSVPVEGSNIKVMYDGQLSKNGAKQIIAHIEFGEKLENADDYMMDRNSTCFETSFQLSGKDTLKLSFSDGSGNVDDNHGNNYAYDMFRKT